MLRLSGKYNVVAIALLFICLFTTKGVFAQIYSNGFEGVAIAGTTSFTGGATGDPGLNIAASAWSTDGVFTTFVGTAPTAPTSMALQPGSAATTTWTLNVPVNPGFTANITALDLDYRSTSTSYNALSITINGTPVYAGTALTDATFHHISLTGLSISGITTSISIVSVMSGGSHGSSSTFRYDNVAITGTVVAANHPPAFVGGASQSASVCQDNSIPVNSLMSVTDADAGQTETWTVITPPANGTLGGFPTTAGSTGGAVTPSGLTYTPTAGYSGPDVFTIRVSDGAATATTTVNVTVNPAPPAITGSTSVCTGAAASLSDAVPGGTWISAAPGIATIDPVSGVVSGVATGIAPVTYTNGGTGCIITATVTVNPTPLLISGSALACIGANTALSDPTPGGVWSSSNPGVATVSVSGVVTGLATGPAVISYTVGSCFVTAAITVNTMTPVLGATSVCAGSMMSLSDATAGGTWSSGNGAIATVDPVTGVVSGVSGGTVDITYTNGTTGCIATAPLLVNTGPTAISGPSGICIGSILRLSDAVAGGTWSSDNSSVATIDGSGFIYGVSGGTTVISYMVGMCAVSTSVSVTTLAPITGSHDVCAGTLTMLSDATPGGVWSSANTLAATVSSTGIVTGVQSGSAAISYSIGACSVSLFMTVGFPIEIITGVDSVCTGIPMQLSDASIGGFWNSSDASVAVVSGGGFVSGISPGVVNISYSVGGCTETFSVTVKAGIPGPISGKDSMCMGLGHTIMLSDAVPGGTWSSTNTARATVDPVIGHVTAILAGVDTIKYAVSNTCGSFVVRKVLHIRTALQCATGVDPAEAEVTGSLLVFPNPNTGSFTLKLQDDENEEAHIIITSLLGAKVREFISAGNRTTDIHLDVAPGIYLISATTPRNRYIVKITIN